MILDPAIRRAAREDAEAISRTLHEAFIDLKPLYTEDAFAATVPSAAGVATPQEYFGRPVFGMLKTMS